MSSCEAVFGVKGKHLTHRMYILDTLACHQKLLLGMDFIREQQLNIDMGKDTITLPETQDYSACLRCASNRKIPLRSNYRHSGAYPAGRRHWASLDEGLIMLEAVQTTSDGNVTAWLTNTTDASMNIEAGEAIAFWEPDMDGELSLLTHSTTR